MPETTTSLRRLGGRLVRLVLCAALAPGCTSWTRVPPSQGMHEALHPGDRLRVITRDGEEHKVVLAALTNNELVAELPGTGVAWEPAGNAPRDLVATAPAVEPKKLMIDFSDIVRIERSDVDGGKSALLVLGGGLALLGTIALLFIMSPPGPYSGAPGVAGPGAAGR